MWSIKDFREIGSEIKSKMERDEYKGKIEREYGFPPVKKVAGKAYEIINKQKKPEVYLYVITGVSKYVSSLGSYVSPEKPEYNLILREYGLEETSYKPGIIFLIKGIDEVGKLRTSEEWDDRFILPHELAHHEWREIFKEAIFHSNSNKLKESYESIKRFYDLFFFRSQINRFLNSYEVYQKLEKCSKGNLNINELRKDMESYVEEIYKLSKDALKDLRVLDESYAIIVEILTVLEYVRNNDISRDYAIKYLHNQIGKWIVSYIYNFALNKIFDRFDENSRIWKLMSEFLKYRKVSEIDLIKELEQKREDLLREIEEELYRLPDKTNKKLEEMSKKKPIIEENLERLKRLVDQIY
jgi:hypothetical protein